MSRARTIIEAAMSPRDLAVEDAALDFVEQSFGRHRFRGQWLNLAPAERAYKVSQWLGGTRPGRLVQRREGLTAAELVTFLDQAAVRGLNWKL